MIVRSPQDFGMIIRGQNRTTAVERPQGLSQKSKGLRPDIARAPNNFHSKSVEALRLPYDLHAIFSQNFDESKSKKSHDVRMYIVL